MTSKLCLDSKNGENPHLLARHWRPCGSTDLWDLEHRGTRILMATERGQGIAKRTLVRLSGPATAQEIRETFEKAIPIPKAAAKLN